MTIKGFKKNKNCEKLLRLNSFDLYSRVHNTKKLPITLGILAKDASETRTAVMYRPLRNMFLFFFYTKQITDQDRLDQYMYRKSYKIECIS